MKLKLLPLLLVVAALSASCDDDPSPPERVGWPAFEASYRETAGVNAWDFRIEYRSADDWQTETTQPGGSRAVYEGETLRFYSPDTELASVQDWSLFPVVQHLLVGRRRSEWCLCI